MPQSLSLLPSLVTRKVVPCTVTRPYMSQPLFYLHLSLDPTNVTLHASDVTRNTLALITVFKVAVDRHTEEK